MSTVVIPNTLAGVVVAAQLQENTQVLADCINGNLDNENIRASANIDINKLSATYEYISIPLVLPSTGGALAGAALRPITLHPFYNDSKGNWSITRISWVCDDTGDGNAIIKLHFGYYTAAGAWSSVAYSANIALANSAAGADSPNQGNVAPSTVEVAFDANQRSFGMYVVGAGANVIQAAGSAIVMTVHLKRQIKT